MLLENAWNMTGTCLVYAWDMLGMCVWTCVGLVKARIENEKSYIDPRETQKMSIGRYENAFKHKNFYNRL